MDYIKLMRVKHYVKNFLVLIPLFFNRNIFDINKLIYVLIGFVSFCLISSAVYIVNDIKDIEKDRRHPKKKDRPLASGKVKIKNAVALMVVCAILAVILTVVVNPTALFLLLLYFALNLGYSLGLKNYPIIDVIILASGFVIRVLYGGLVTGVPVSKWLYLVIIFGSLYMGLGKRRNELRQQKDTREVLKYYDEAFLDKNMYVSVTLVIAFYALWTLDLAIGSLIWTVPFLAIILLRYSYDIEGKSDADPVEVLLHDKVLTVMGILYVIFIFILLYII